MSDIDNLRKALQGISSKLDQLNSSFWDKFLYINPSRKIIQRLLGLLNSPQIDGVLFDSQYKTLISKLNSLIEIEHLDESWTQFIQSINVLKQRVVNPAAQRKNLGFLSEINFTTLDSFNQSKFSLEERADSWEIKGINGSLVYLLRALLPAKTQDEHAEHREANNIKSK
ncbi:hypothetical protein HYT56_05255 [Candidatus Woesearchaeota archaeon]|nr:hypothetical protein [Candidatus Woesearchaeota archaeon]